MTGVQTCALPIFAHDLGMRVEGIGSKTKRYYWINAFVREYIATVATKWKTNLKVTAVLILINAISAVLMYISETVLF